MPYQQADLEHVFDRNTSMTDVDILFVADQPEKEGFRLRNPQKGRYCASFIQLERQTRLAFRNRWLMNYGQEPRDIKRLFTFVSNRWLGPKPSHEALTQEAKELLHLVVNRYNPKIIIALGKSVSKIFGIDKPIKIGRNRIYSIHVNNHSFKMLPTFGLTDLSSKFKYETHIRLDLIKAFDEICRQDLGDMTAVLKEEIKLHQYYRTYEQVKAFHTWFRKSGIKEITVDFETTGLKYYKPDERIIMVAIGLGNKRAVTILLDHREHPEPENLPAIWDLVRDILEDESIAKINHNIKFDYQMALKEPYKIEMKNIVWCTQLAEHLCFEEKTDGYNLDTLTSEYVPVFANYKAMVSPDSKELDKVLVNLEAEKQRYDALVEQWKMRKNTWDIQKQFDKQEHIDAMAMYTNHKKTHENKLKVWEDEVTAWQEAVLSWKEQSKGTRGPKPKKPPKPKLEEKKPSVPSFKEKKPTKTDEHKRLEERLKQLKKDKKDKTYEDVDLAVLEVYAAIDGDVTYRIFEKQKVYLYQEHEQFIEKQTEFYSLNYTIPLPQGYQRPDVSQAGTPEYRTRIKQVLRQVYPSTLDLMRTQVRYMSETIGDMEFRGSALDYEKVQKMHTDMEVMQQKALADIQYYAKRADINPNSDKEMLTLLNTYNFENILTEMDLPREYTEKNNELSLKAEYLEKWQETFAKLDNPCAKVFQALANYRKANKCKDTYLANYLEYGKIDGHIHTEFFIYGTSGARLSSGKPNLQNIPKKSNMLGIDVKKLFIPTIVEGETHVHRIDTTND